MLTGTQNGMLLGIALLRTKSLPSCACCSPDAAIQMWRVLNITTPSNFYGAKLAPLLRPCVLDAAAATPAAPSGCNTHVDIVH